MLSLESGHKVPTKVRKVILHFETFVKQYSIQLYHVLKKPPSSSTLLFFLQHLLFEVPI